MSKHEQMLEASIHFWVLREETRVHEPGHEEHCPAKEKIKECASDHSKRFE